MCAMAARFANEPGARRRGCRSASAMGGTLPVARPRSSAARIGFDPQAVRAGALLNGLVLAHAASAAAQTKRAHDLRGHGEACDELVDIRLRRNRAVHVGHGFSVELRTARGYARHRARAAPCSPAACDSPVRSAWSVGGPMFLQSAARGRVRLRRSGPALHRLRHGLRAAALRAHASRAGGGLGRARKGRLRLGSDSLGRGSPRREDTRPSPLDGAAAFRHDGDRGDDERDSRGARVHGAFADPQVWRRLSRPLRPRAARCRGVRRISKRAQRHPGRR